MLRRTIGIVRQFISRLGHDAVSAYAAQAAFFIVISCFPFAMLLITILQFLPFSQTDMLQYLSRVFPTSILSFIETTMQDVMGRSMGNATLIAITSLTALWASSKGFYALMQGLNAINGIEEKRPWIVLKLLASLYTLAFAVLLIITLALLVFGNSLYRWIVAQIPSITDLAIVIISVRTFVSFTIMALFFLLLYLFIPNRRIRKQQFLTELPGAMLSALGWIGFSYLYSYYIEHFGQNSYVYGSLTAVVLLMLWLYICMYMMLVGAEINVVLRSGVFEPIHEWWIARRERKKARHARKGTEEQQDSSLRSE